MKKTVVYVMAHKKFQQQLPEEYQPLHVGAALHEDIGYPRDDVGDHISAKNKNYCELTGLYWIWKNSDADIVGLCHYRRYFSNCPFDKKLKHILTKAEIEKRLAAHDIILPYPTLCKMNNGAFYCKNHMVKDYELTRAAIQAVSPDYINAFDQFMTKHTGCQCNMFIASKRIADAYCAWLFSIYDEMEKYVDFSDYNAYQARMFGFMSERLLNVWCEQNCLRASHAYFASTEANYLQAIKDKISEFSLKNK